MELDMCLEHVKPSARMRLPSVRSTQPLGADEGPADGRRLGILVGPAVGILVGPAVGPVEGTLLGATVGPAVGPVEGALLGPVEGVLLGPAVGTTVGFKVSIGSLPPLQQAKTIV
jgi:hypothetical protein